MSVADFRTRHPKIFTQILRRGIAAQMTMLDDKRLSNLYGKIKHTYMIDAACE
jgi:hypothetical protein